MNGPERTEIGGLHYVLEFPGDEITDFDLANLDDEAKERFKAEVNEALWYRSVTGMRWRRPWADPAPVLSPPESPPPEALSWLESVDG